MKRQLIALVFFIFSAASAFAQAPAYTIKAKIPASANQTIYLAHYFGNNQYIKVDSAKTQNGVLTFEGKEPLKGGMYLLVYSPSVFYDFLVSGTEPNIEISADTSDYVGTVKFKGSKENDLLFSYRRFLQNKNKEAEGIQAKSQQTKDIAATQAAMKKLQAEVKAYSDKFAQDNAATFAGKIIKANSEPELPTTIPNRPDGRPDSTYLFNYYKSHYLSGIDFTDDRLIRTPFLQTKIDNYFKNLVYQTPDSVIVDADRVVQPSRKNTDVYRYVLWQVTNKYETSEVLGMDKVFVHLAENYYLKDATWLDSTQRAKFAERVRVLKPLLIGKPFPELIMTDLNGKDKRVNDSKAKYTVVAFYSPDCGHCKDAAPSLLKFARDYASKGVKVYNISADYDVKKVKEFVEKYNLQELENGWDSRGRYDFKQKFDVFTTPTTYVLDENGVIIARKIAEQELSRFMDFYLSKKP